MEYTERQKQIIELLSERSLSVTEIANKLFASEMTIRRDISYLKSIGVLNQYRGGVALRVLNSFTSFELRYASEKAEKMLLGAKAAELVEDGMMIYIDNSSTCSYIVPFLEDRRDIMVVTNSSKVIEDLGEMKKKVKMASGNYAYFEKCVVGSETEEYIRNYRYDIAFISATGYDDKMIMCYGEAQANIRRVVIESAAKTYVLMTRSKRNRRSKFVVCDIKDVCLITHEDIEEPENDQ